MKTALIFTVITILFTFGCSEDFPDAGELGNENQILAIKTEPPEVGIGDETLITPLVHWPQGDENYLWFICLPDKKDKTDNLSTCIIDMLEEQNGQVDDCGVNPDDRLCILSHEKEPSYTVPDILWFSASTTTQYFYAMMIASDQGDPLTECDSAWREMIPDSKCLLSGKRIVYNPGVITNRNPEINGLVFGEETADPTGIYTISGGKAVFHVDFDLSTVDEFIPDVENTLRLQVSFFTTCGTIDPWRESIVCSSTGDPETAGCEALEMELKADVSGECVIHTVLIDKNYFGEDADVIEGTDPYVPGLTWLSQRILIQ
ncbi:MAG: hypothetical protein JXR95_08910 [Deltaproteobacteria bacterium]|nr:hypothetical protein [Deltaproteobacteria bacterium]